jgi:uncharacterized membrane protein
MAVSRPSGFEPAANAVAHDLFERWWDRDARPAAQPAAA